MNIKDFIVKYKNHPVLFIGTGMNLRYLNNSYSWDGLLGKIAFDLKGNDEYYLDVKSNNFIDGKYSYESIAQEIEKEFNAQLVKERDGKFKNINDILLSNPYGSLYKIHGCITQPDKIIITTDDYKMFE